MRISDIPNAEFFHLSADDFLHADQDSWMWQAIFDAVNGSRPESAEEREEIAKEEALRLAGWYWWTCVPGCLPDSDAFGPFKTAEEAVRDCRDLGDL